MRSHFRRGLILISRQLSHSPKTRPHPIAARAETLCESAIETLEYSRAGHRNALDPIHLRQEEILLRLEGLSSLPDILPARPSVRERQRKMKMRQDWRAWIFLPLRILRKSHSE